MENSTVYFHESIKKVKLKTLFFMTKVAKVLEKDPIIPMKAQSELFGSLAVMMQSKSNDLKQVFSYLFDLQT